MADPALERLRGHLYRFNSTGDMTNVLGDEVLRDIKALSSIKMDMAAMEIVAWLYWYRSQALSGAAASAERESATKLFELIYVTDPQAVPGALQPVLAERRAAKQEKVFAKSPFAQPALDVQQTMRRSAELFQSYHTTGDPALLDDSISGFRSLLVALPPGHILRPMVEVTLGLALQQLWERSNNGEVLAEAVAQLRSGLAALPPAHEIRPMAMAALAVLLTAQYTEHEDHALLTEAKALIGQAAAIVPPGSPMAANIQSAKNMLDTVLPAAAPVPDEDRLENAVETARARLDQAPPGHPERQQRLMELGMALATRAGATRLPGGLAESADLLREVVASMPAGSAQLPTLRGALAGILAELADQQGDLAMSQEAIDMLRQALASVPATSPAAPMLSGNLATALWRRYGATDDPVLLDEAIKECRRALDVVAADSPVRHILLQNFAGALHDLHRRTGDMAALDESIDLAHRAERTAPPGTPRQWAAMNTLAVGLVLRYRRTGDPGTAQEAVSWARKGAAAVPKDHPDRLTIVVTLAQALTEAAAGAQAAEYSEAIDLLREAAHALRMRPTRLADLRYVANALATALLERSSAAPDLSAVEEAIRWLQWATADQMPGADRDRCLGLLGMALQRRYDLTLDRGALAEALAAFDAAVGPDSSPIMRVLRNTESGRTAAKLPDWPLAAKSFTAAIEGLPQLADRFLDRGDQEFQLIKLAGLAGEAAASALNAGQPEHAATLLEQGRGVLLNQALEMRGDLGQLAERAPSSAARLIALRDQLDALGRPHADPAPAETDSAYAGRRTDLRRGLVAEWDELIGTIREQGLGDFLRPPTPAQLAEAAKQGPIVMLSVSSYRSDAILLTPDGLDVVELRGRGSFRTEVAERTSLFGEAVEQVIEADAEPEARARITDTLGWLWDSVAERVLERLGLLGDPPGSELTRVWWCGGGPLSLLPMHAAGRDGIAVIDKVVSSYTPTVRALMHSRSRAPKLDPAAGMLVVAMRRTPGQLPLPRADAERKFLEETFSANTLFNEEATTDRVIAALPKYATAHFACHCDTNLADPSASGLLCHDHRSNPLSVARLSRLDLPDAALAYLSACATSQTSAALADEAVHVTSAFQIAGYAQVIGTLWPVGDKVSSEMARSIYASLGQQGAGGRSAAYAVHNAVCALRRDNGAETTWAPYVHVGA